MMEISYVNIVGGKVGLNFQIKTFRLKYVSLAGNIIRSARYVVMKLPAKYPYKDVYEKCLA